MQRRRFIQIAATAAGLSLCPNWLRANSLKPVRWQGFTMGALGQFTLYSETPERTQSILDACFAEIRRLEGIFSLYDHQSELSRLNRTGRLNHPSTELIEVLQAADSAYQLTEGHFDPTVQTLWQVYQQHFAENPQCSDGPGSHVIESALKKVNWQLVDFEPQTVSFRQAGMALTLNGIAQGYITDRITDQLKQAGFKNVLVELGETRALGTHPEKRPWQIGIETPDRKGLKKVVPLQDQAMATSGSYGSTFSSDGKYHHLIHPKTGLPTTNWQSISVIASTATEADALSTGLSFATQVQIDQLRKGSELQIFCGLNLHSDSIIPFRINNGIYRDLSGRDHLRVVRSVE